MEGNHGGDASGEVLQGEGALPGPFVGTLFAACLGGMVPGVYMTLVAAPGLQGSPLHGLLLPWTMLPFLLAVSAAWLSRRLPEASPLRWHVVGVAVAGACAYTYFVMFHPRGVKNIQAFLYIPLWQWLLMARSMVRAVMAWRRSLTPPPP
ncbi:MAG: hypothetical protein WCR07_09020 [Verrucomicrobiota bacterium]|jgi:hypothetical protein